ncbi:hypothetical protein BpHYR1_049110 [Brachionus plicatilis]|uniref:Uncharacterized protein n=1 Tax=Brachionus plicatilis TaxID=10195 RepID=A0A3M7QI90_BRAPC|nr:hypothetical protein BpHYR1_049110 [Brachionus plicatilis]
MVFCNTVNFSLAYISRKKIFLLHVIGIVQLELLEFPTLDLNIEKNSKRGRRKKALPALERNSTGPLNVQIFRSIQANIEPSYQTQSATTSNQILSIDGNNQLLENQNGQTAKLSWCNIQSCINFQRLLMMCKISTKCTALEQIEI